MAWHFTEYSEWKCGLYNFSNEYNNFESEDFVRALLSLKITLKEALTSDTNYKWLPSVVF